MSKKNKNYIKVNDRKGLGKWQVKKSAGQNLPCVLGLSIANRLSLNVKSALN